MTPDNVVRSIVASVRLLSTEAGGRYGPIKSGVYRPRFVLGRMDVSCRFDGMEKDPLAPGEETNAIIAISLPESHEELLVPGVRFDLREGPKVVGWGTIKDIAKS